MSDLAALNNSSGNDALATSLDASSTICTAAVVGSFGGTFGGSVAGTFEGLGNTISNLTITGSSNLVGLFGSFTNSTLRDMGIIGGSVSGNQDVGEQIGGNVVDVYATGTVRAQASSAG